MRARLLICLLAMATSANASTGRGVVVPPATPVHGLSQAEWSLAWWQWAGSFDIDESPIADETGELCSSKQDGAVWFLAGTYGTRRTIRTCKIPRGKYLFFPLVNYVVMPPANRTVSCMSVTEEAAAVTDGATNLILEVDGVRVRALETFRQPSGKCFDMGARTEKKYRVFPSAANGYYVMLRPLGPGTHTINFGGVLPDMQQAVTYTVQVE